MACCLRHNHIRSEMSIDPFENNFEPYEGTRDDGSGDHDNITSIGTSSMVEKGRTYRNWSAHEDAKLLEALVNMVNEGPHKADNGFKSGYLQHLETAMKTSLPNADWQIVYDMVIGTNTSGFGYDNVNKCVMVTEPAVWESYISVHKVVAKWRNKPFPHFEYLCIVFGKDRAQGDRARDFIEMENDANMEE